MAGPAAYPQEPFRQAESLLAGLIESYRASSDAAEMREIQGLVQATVQLAHEREFRVDKAIKELSRSVASAEAAAVYSDAKAQHERRIAEINAAVAGLQQQVAAASDDLRGVSDQHAALEAKQQELQEAKQELAKTQAKAEADKLKLISMYAYISGVSFENWSALEQPVVELRLTDGKGGDLPAVRVDQSAPAFETANKLWACMPVPPLPQ